MVFNPFKPHLLLRPRWLVRRSLRQKSRRTIPSRVRLDWDIEMEVGGDELGTAIWRAGVYEIAVSETVWRLLGPGDRAVDAGANIGYMTGLMARKAGPTGTVYAFEPHPEVFRELQENVRLIAEADSTGTVHAFQVALSDRRWEPVLVCDPQFRSNRGTAHLGVADGSSIMTTDVKAAPLDDLLPEDQPVAVLKVDVEGHELSLFRGAEGLLRSGRIRNIVYEAHGEKAGDVREYLDSFGYRQFALGWRFSGLALGPPERRLSRWYEPPNYLATLDPDTPRKLALRGWTFWRKS
jgi:FkbM family methyltransferase